MFFTTRSSSPARDWQSLSRFRHIGAVDLEIEKELRRRLQLFTPTQRRALFRLLASPDSKRAEAVAAIWASGEAEALSGLLTDLQRDRFSRTLVLGARYELDCESSG